MRIAAMIGLTIGVAAAVAAAAAPAAAPTTVAAPRIEASASLARVTPQRGGNVSRRTAGR
jgi:hypothetical protein